MTARKIAQAHLSADLHYRVKKIAKLMDEMSGVATAQREMQRYQTHLDELMTRYLDTDDAPNSEAIAAARMQAEAARQDYLDEQSKHGSRGAEVRLQRIKPEKAERDTRIRKRHKQLIEVDEPSVVKQLMREFDCSKSTIERAIKN